MQRTEPPAAPLSSACLARIPILRPCCRTTPKPTSSPTSTSTRDEDESSLPAIEEDAPAGRSRRRRGDPALRQARPEAPGVYRMIDAKGEVLYVGKAKSIRKRIVVLCAPGRHTARISA
jgi:excinuclease ABC subunit C